MNKWHDYTGRYNKRWYDIELHDGYIYRDCYPNAGMFHVQENNQHWYIEGALVKRVRPVSDPLWRKIDGISTAPTKQPPLTMQSIQNTVNDMKMQPVLSTIKTWSLKALLEKLGPVPEVQPKRTIDSIYGVPIVVDEEMEPNKIKLVFSDTREETYDI